MSSIFKVIVMAAVAATPVAVQAETVRASSAMVAGPGKRAPAPVRTGAQMEEANQFTAPPLPIVLAFVGMGIATAVVARAMRNSRSPR